jgi:hypothetical protein
VTLKALPAGAWEKEGVLDFRVVGVPDCADVCVTVWVKVACDSNCQGRATRHAHSHGGACSLLEQSQVRSTDVSLVP